MKTFCLILNHDLNICTLIFIIGEAAEKVLREKKISNKLNYDVLKSLNMDDFVKSMNFDNQLAE